MVQESFDNHFRDGSEEDDRGSGSSESSEFSSVFPQQEGINSEVHIVRTKSDATVFSPNVGPMVHTERRSLVFVSVGDGDAGFVGTDVFIRVYLVRTDHPRNKWMVFRRFHVFRKTGENEFPLWHNSLKISKQHSLHENIPQPSFVMPHQNGIPLGMKLFQRERRRNLNFFDSFSHALLEL